MLSFPQGNGLNPANITSNTSAINQHQELMLLDLEKCSIKNLWKDKLEKVESAQSEKNYSLNASMKSLDKLLFLSQKEVSSFSE